MVDGQRDPAPTSNLWRKRFGGEHLLFVWTRLTDGSEAGGPKSPPVGYAPPEYRMKPWPDEALIAGWFPTFWESSMVSLPVVS